MIYGNGGGGIPRYFWMRFGIQPSNSVIILFFTYFNVSNINQIIFLGMLSRSFVVVVESLRCIWLFATPWTVAHQAPLSFTISQSLLRFMSTESVMLANHLILCCLLLPSIAIHKRCESNPSVPQRMDEKISKIWYILIYTIIYVYI